MTFTPAVGTPATDSALGEHIEIWKKATGGSTAITIGRVVVLTDSTGTCAQATTGSYGRAGVVYNGYPNQSTITNTTFTVGTINTDSSANVAVITGDGAKVYVTCTGSIPRGSRVTFGTSGTVAAYTETNTSAISSTLKLPIGVYEGHYGESEQSAGSAPTDATTGQVVRIKLGGVFG